MFFHFHAQNPQKQIGSLAFHFSRVRPNFDSRKSTASRLGLVARALQSIEDKGGPRTEQHRRVLITQERGALLPIRSKGSLLEGRRCARGFFGRNPKTKRFSKGVTCGKLLVPILQHAPGFLVSKSKTSGVRKYPKHPGVPLKVSLWCDVEREHLV